MMRHNHHMTKIVLLRQTVSVNSEGQVKMTADVLLLHVLVCSPSLGLLGLTAFWI